VIASNSSEHAWSYSQRAGIAGIGADKAGEPHRREMAGSAPEACSQLVHQSARASRTPENIQRMMVD
jgi:hypothetical protein